MTAPDFLVGGEMGRLMREFDWGRHPLGPADGWPQSLKSAVSICLGSRFPILLWWGPALYMLYNDAYRPMLGTTKHPKALGQMGRECWPEIWHIIGPMLEESVLKRGEATWSDDQLLLLERHGFAEECYFTFTYSPIRDETGGVGGVFCAVVETTGRVIGERRLRVLSELAARTLKSLDAEAACRAAAGVFDEASADVTFAHIYLADAGGTARLAASTRAAHPAGAPLKVALAHPSTEWPLHLAPRADLLPWGGENGAVFIVPILSGASDAPTGFLVAAPSRRRPFDEDYRSFLSLVASRIGSAVADARALEAERQRAEALAELDRAKTTFFSNISHEFRTPLTLMLDPTEEALASHDGTMGRADLERIHRSQLRLLKLVNTLLDYSRLEAGRVSARFEPLDLSTFTADIASTFRSAMEKADLDYRVQCAPLPHHVHVDRDMWEKILLNLLSNAFKFTLSGHVTVGLAPCDEGARLTVEDSGIGIPPEDLPLVFERFHRVERACGRSQEGSGIGLALVSELVKMHGGTLAATSEIGRGTRFTVTLPFGSAHLPAEHVSPVAREAAEPAHAEAYVTEALQWLRRDTGDLAPTMPVAVPQPPGAAASHPHVLLADDNADMREYVQRLLSDRWSVEAVTNGREALGAARARRPDVIVTDVMMPELDGFGLLREVRADASLRATPVVMLSARAGEEARVEGLSATADDYVAKPFSARELLARIEAQIFKTQLRSVEQRHHERLTSLFAHAPVAIAVFRGADHVYEFVNPPYLELVGGRPVLGKPIREALPELAGQDIVDLLDQVRTSSKPYVGRSLRATLNRGTCGAPEECYFDFVYQPMFEADGRADAIVLVGSDVTELAVAKREAEAANRIKDEFLATLSHELRTPLNAVLGYTHILKTSTLDVQRRERALETIERNARLQEKLIGDILDLSRTAVGKLRLELRPLDLCEVIANALDTVRPAAAAKDVVLDATLTGEVATVLGDGSRLQQVVWNLLSNAVKFTPRGGRVEVSLERADANVTIVVRDTGEGIPPEFLPHLFQAFRQADTTLSRAHGGLGIGLALSRHIVEAHGGRILANSAGLNHGTTMRVVLPLTAARAAVAPDDALRSA